MTEKADQRLTAHMEIMQKLSCVQKKKNIFWDFTGSELNSSYSLVFFF